MKLIRPITVADGGAFSRASPATYYDKNGVLQIAPADAPRLSYDPTDLTQPPVWLLESGSENLLAYSADLDNAAWIKGNSTVSAINVADPFGASTADQLTVAASTDGTLSQGFTPKSLTPHNRSLWIRTPGASFTLNSYAVRIAPYTVVHTGQVVVTSTWQRVDWTFTPIDLTMHRLQIGGAFSLAGRVIEVAGAQVSPGVGVQPLIRTAGAPLAGQPMMLFNSANPYNGTGWNLNGLPANGTLTTVGLFSGVTFGSNGAVWNGKSQGFGLAPGTWAVSVYFKPGTSGKIFANLGKVDNSAGATVNGVYMAPPSSFFGGMSIVGPPTVSGPDGSGIYALRYVASVSDAGIYVLSVGTGSTIVGENFTLYGAQLEPNEPSSFYPTIAPTVRARDVHSRGLLSNVPEPDAGDAPAWSDTSLVTAGTTVRTVSHEVFKATVGGPTATVTFTASNANASVNWTNHGLANGTPVAFVNASGALPTAITPGVTYYVVGAAANSFGVAATINGAGIVLATTGSGVHTAQSNPNYGRDPTLAANAAYWVKVGPTNRWAMFDQLSNTVTTEADVLAAMIDVDERIDTVALLNINAASARVIVTDATAGIVYDKVHSLVSTDGVDNAWDWCFSPIERVADLTIEDLPPYYSPTVQVILSAPGETSSCGMCLMGLSYLIGGTQYGAQVGIQDYSVKSTDDFGNIEITPRSYAKRGTFSARFPKGRTDSVVKRLTEFRTTPALWLGSGEYQSTAIFGFYKDFSVLIDQLSHSLCEIEIEGLT